MAKKDALRDDIAAAAAKLPTTTGGGRELKKLVDHLWEDERVDTLLVGSYGYAQGLLTLTNRRLLFTKDGVMSARSEDFPLERVTSIQWNSAMVSGRIVIFASGNKAEIANVDKAVGKTFVDKVRDRIALSGQPAADPRAPEPAALPQAPDAADQLRKLADLHAAGILTDEEFASKKAEILGRM